MLPLVILLPLLALLKFLLEFQEKNSPLSSTYCISCYLFHCDARTCCGCTTTPTITILWCGHTHKKWFCGVSLPTKTILWRQPSPARTSNSQNGWLVVLIQPVSSSFLCVVTPGFKNKTKCISYVCQDQVYTHMIDVISEYIKNSVQNIDKRE